MNALVKSGGRERPFPLCLGMLPIGLLLLFVLALPDKARAEDQSHIIGGVSCPTASFCAAFQIGGTYLLTANPTLDSSWRAMNVTETGVGTTGLSCPSDGFCAIADYSGDVITSADPSSPEPTWSTAHVDIEPVSRGAKRSLTEPASVPIEGIACPSTTLCVAIDSKGNVLSSTKPGGGAAAWHRENLDAPNQFDAISCAPGSTFCAAVDMEGRLFVSDARGWWRVDLALGEVGSWRGPAGLHEHLLGHSCPTVGFCMAFTSESQIFTSTEPANPAFLAADCRRATHAATLHTLCRSDRPKYERGTRIRRGDGRRVDGENIMSCPSTSFCAIPGFSRVRNLDDQRPHE